jgi:hypothetical protein
MGDFGKFVETYKDDIKVFFESLIAFVKALIAKLGEDDAATE